ncbi:lectin L6-like [Pomacea canaliculata]|uniref:lectin L6-like n=1 Tax=Pomacea canaliculata TaxID=400727 RepID=UPI000D72AEDB|nr:lectin L6-like [Pomacea canaliculata]
MELLGIQEEQACRGPVLTGTYQEPNVTATSWTHVPGSLEDIDVGTDIVVGLNSLYAPFYRKNITRENPTGTSWVQLDGHFKYLTATPHGAIWGLDEDYSLRCFFFFFGRCRKSTCQLSAPHSGICQGASPSVKLSHLTWYRRWPIWFRDGISLDNPGGTGWQKVDGRFHQISAGPSGVWTVDFNEIYYREGTYGGNITMGSGWTKVDGNLRYVASGSDVVVAVNGWKQLLRRTGISETNPTGDQWVPMDGQLYRIDEYGGTMWGVTTRWNTFTSPTN